MIWNIFETYLQNAKLVVLQKVWVSECQNISNQVWLELRQLFCF